MEIVLNKYLFFTLLLLSINEPVVNTTAELKISFETKSIEIQYTDIQFASNYKMELDSLLKKLQNIKTYSNESLRVNFQSVQFRTVEGISSLTLLGNYEEKSKLIKAFEIYLEKDKLKYYVLNEELIIYTNGEVNNDTISWNTNTHKIILNLKRKLDSKWENDFKENMGQLKPLIFH